MKKTVSKKTVFTGFKEEPASFYNRAYANKGNDYHGPPEDSRFYKIWFFILEHYIEKPTTILDIGCGTGQFGAMCTKRRHRYIGVDYSKVAIKVAKKMCPKGKFYVRDIIKKRNAITNGRYKVITFVEFLEHIQDDLGVIKSVPKGKTIIATLPSFGGKPHIRYFPTVLSAKERYDKYIKYTKVKRISKKHIVIMGVRK